MIFMKNLNSLSEPTWTAFWKEVRNELVIPRDIKMGYRSFPCFDTAYSLNAVGAWAGEPDEHQTHPHFVHAELNHKHHLLPFNIKMDLSIHSVHENAASFQNRYSVTNLFPFDLLGRTVGVPELYTEFIGYQPLDRFYEFLQMLNFALVKMSVHPERDAFMGAWTRYFGILKFTDWSADQIAEDFHTMCTISGGER